MDALWMLWTDPNMRWIVIGCMLLGLSSGLIGCYMLLQKRSLIGDALAHAALPGICIAFMLTGVKSTTGFVLGALVAGAIATWGIRWLTNYSRIKQDAAMGIVLSLFFGIGVMLLTRIQHSGAGGQSGLDKFLFGQAASMMRADVYMLAGISILLLVLCVLLYKPFKLISFDPGFARGLGWQVARLEQLMLLLAVLVVVAGIQAVGVVLMSALLITPAVAARYWTNKLYVMLLLAGMFGAMSGLSGTFWSGMLTGLPTGPVTVLSATLLFALSALFAPQRGWIGKRWRQRRARRAWTQGGATHEQ
ncbi:metal ABC transporter permease [Paenibacillus campi]|uniref:metal ABC transporter permease n=1 Tax=Paenibacillus campi TaxID=3106031 RepID=UPI002AFFA036|nr:iron chelate uptake ABC transporter family permease subunit [Paenibacillus sp. SGZ-1014]